MNPPSIAKPYVDAGLRGMIYTLAATGDGLERHTHTEADVHITVVMQGSIRASGDGWQEQGGAGLVLSFAAGEPHEIVALEPDTKILQLVKTVALRSSSTG